MSKLWGPLLGRRLADAIPMTGDHTDVLLEWAGDEDLVALEGEFVRLRFVMREASIYSVRAE